MDEYLKLYERNKIFKAYFVDYKKKRFDVRIIDDALFDYKDEIMYCDILSHHLDEDGDYIDPNDEYSFEPAELIEETKLMNFFYKLMPKTTSKVITKLINSIMLDGKKGIAQTILYEAFDIVKEKTGEEPLTVFEKAMENIKPTLEVKSRRVGGSNYQVPVEVSANRSQALGLRWLVKFARLRGGKGMAVNLANEIVDASNGTGAAVKKREDTHRMAEANKAYAHYRW